MTISAMGHYAHGQPYPSASKFFREITNPIADGLRITL